MQKFSENQKIADNFLFSQKAIDEIIRPSLLAALVGASGGSILSVLDSSPLTLKKFLRYALMGGLGAGNIAALALLAYQDYKDKFSTLIKKENINKQLEKAPMSMNSQGGQGAQTVSNTEASNQEGQGAQTVSNTEALNQEGQGAQTAESDFTNTWNEPVVDRRLLQESPERSWLSSLLANIGVPAAGFGAGYGGTRLFLNTRNLPARLSQFNFVDGAPSIAIGTIDRDVQQTLNELLGGRRNYPRVVRNYMQNFNPLIEELTRAQNKANDSLTRWRAISEQTPGIIEAINKKQQELDRILKTKAVLTEVKKTPSLRPKLFPKSKIPRNVGIISAILSALAWNSIGKEVGKKVRTDYTQLPQ